MKNNRPSKRIFQYQKPQACAQFLMFPTTPILRLAPDLWLAMHALAEAKGLDMDRQVNDALREWLKRGKK